MIQLIDAVPPRAYDWAGYELTQHAQHAADVHADRLTTYGSYDVHDNEPRAHSPKPQAKAQERRRPSAMPQQLPSTYAMTPP